MSIYTIDPLDFSSIRTVSLAERPNKVRTGQFAKRVTAAQAALLDSLPDILAAADLRKLATAVVAANRSKRRVLFGLGAHVLKVGLSPILIQLVQDDFIDGIALNGAGIVHDFEIALVGSTSENVDEALPGGRFGVARETAESLNGAIAQAARDGIGIGEAVGKLAAELRTPTAHLSLLGACYRARTPVTVHVAIGTDILHIHPSAEGAAIGAASLRDFRLFAALVAGLDGGGVYLNLGSAVVLPEVFLKAIAAVRALGLPLEGFTTANLDFIQHYRPLTNVVRRPTAGHGTGLALAGHHELLVPLLAAALYRERGAVDSPA
jgi:hypothetical protein